MRYQGSEEIIIPSVGTMFAKTLTPTTNTATALAAPNLPIVLEAVRNMIELSSGKAVIAIIVAILEFKLN